MGFLDKLLGRGKQGAEGAEDAVREAGDKTKDVASDVGDKDRVTGEEKGSGESEVTQSEERLDDIRDQPPRDEGRMP
jgi:hypothetical protein